jgi:hypothetical protein
MASIEQAKQAAVAQFLTGEQPTVFRALAVSTKPTHNLTGIGRGPKLVNGHETGQEVLRFYVERKLPPEAVPGGDVLPAVYEGVPTDVIETGRFLAGAPTAAAGVVPATALPGPVRGKLRPTQPGCSVGFAFPTPGMVMAGTYGAVVETGGVWHILSNNHVLADENNLPLGSPIFQPGLLDGGNPATDQVATLTQFVKISLTAKNHVDCAIARILDKAKASPVFLPNVGKLKSTAPIAAAVKMGVEKVGRTTGFTQGEVFDIHATVRVGYTMGTCTFDDQVLVRGLNGTSFSAAGDSGSVIVDTETRRATALLFAGSSAFTIGNKMDVVLAALKVSLVI